MTPAQRLVQRLDELARCTDDPPRLTRLAYSPAMRSAHELVGGWMREAGLAVRMDAVGNLIARQKGTSPAAKTLFLGSHLDTVRDAGRFDGALGVLLALAAVELCGPLPFAVEVLGFIDEEGVRFQSTYLGSRALTGMLSAEDLARRDADGVTLAEAIRAFGGNPEALETERRDPAALLGYIEAHIEQGPVLEAANQALGVVSAIAGQTRVRLAFIGEAGHAGTVPMCMRRDALCGAAEFVQAVEAGGKAKPGLMATVGEIKVSPGASNVIPARAELTLDVRFPEDDIRKSAVTSFELSARRIAAERKLDVDWHVLQSTPAVTCDLELSGRLTRAAEDRSAGIAPPILQLPSGAGHDAAALAALCPVAMLFVRCRGGVSHHPDEFASEEDIGAALHTLVRFLHDLATVHA